MEGSSNVIMGVTVIMVVSLAMVLGLVLVLLAELYCSLLLRRQHLRKNSFMSTPGTATTATTNDVSEQSQQDKDQSTAPSLSSLYSHGVLRAPRNILFPSVSGENEMDLEKQHSHIPEIYDTTQTHSSIFMPLASPKQAGEIPFQCSTSTSYHIGAHGDSSIAKENLIYICNPIYDNEGTAFTKANTPFETPDTSPSRLETIGEEEDDSSTPSSVATTPPLTPMKKLPAEACSISLRDARSLCITGSESNDGNSSSSSGSPCTSPSW